MRAGFSLIEMSIVLLIISIVAAGSLNINASVSARNHYQETDETLETVEDYLKFFYQINDRMPCPASLSAKAGESDFGTEILSGSCNGDTTTPAGTFRVAVGADFLRIGALPTRALKLPDAVMQDGFSQRLLYAVPEKFTDSATYGAATGIITVNDGAGNDLSTEAMYMVLSHGEDRKGAYTGKSGNVGVACGASDNLDVENCNEDATFTDATFNNGDIEAKFFDDRLLWKNKTNFDSEASGAVAAAPATSTPPAAATEAQFGQLACWGWLVGSFARISTPEVVNFDGDNADDYLNLWRADTLKLNVNGAFGIRSQNRKWGWGANNNYASYPNTTTQISSPSNSTASTHAGEWKQGVNSGSDNSCAIKTDDSLWCWGGNTGGVVGDGSSTTRQYPVQISGSWKTVDLSGRHTCALDTTGRAYCWGSGSWGQLGNGGGSSYTPTAVSGGLTFKSISARGNSTCGITTDNEAYCWGRNYYGELGDGTTTKREIPTPVAGGHRFVAIETGTHTCGITTTNETYCWGRNNRGQLGDGSTTDRYTPTLVSGSYDFSKITTGQEHSCGITTDNEAYCWGYNSYGRLGDGTTTDSPTPVKVIQNPAWTENMKWLSISASLISTCAVVAPN